MKSARADDYVNKLLENLHYTKHILIDVTNDPVIVDLVKTKWDEKHKKNKSILIYDDAIKNIIDTPISNKLNHISTNPDDSIKITILGHGFPGSNIISNGSKTNRIEISYSQIAIYLAAFIRDKKVIINLVSCGGGRGELNTASGKTNLSFAAKLQAKLQVLTGRNDIPVVARTHIVALIFDGSKETINLNLPWNNLSDSRESYSHRQPGSKIIVTSEANKQVKLDVYYHLWKNRALGKLAEALQHTKHPMKKIFLQQWIDKFKTMNNIDIATEMKAELDKVTSPLRYHTNFIVGFFKHANAYTEVMKLVNEWKNITDSKFTFKNVELTNQESASFRHANTS